MLQRFFLRVAAHEANETHTTTSSNEVNTVLRDIAYRMMGKGSEMLANEAGGFNKVMFFESQRLLGVVLANLLLRFSRF